MHALKKGRIEPCDCRLLAVTAHKTPQGLSWATHRMSGIPNSKVPLYLKVPLYFPLLKISRPFPTYSVFNVKFQCDQLPS